MNIIVDYGLGNLGSVIRGFNRAGIETKLSRDLDEIKNADSLILPGVGAFGDAMNKLNQLELVAPIRDFAKTGKYMIGICLGCLLYTSYKIEEATDIAMKYTKTDKRLENLKRKSKLILNERHHIPLDEEYDKEKLSAVIDCISNQIDREYVNATLAIEKDGTFKRLPSKEGKKVQKDELQKEIDELIPVSYTHLDVYKRQV